MTNDEVFVEFCKRFHLGICSITEEFVYVRVNPEPYHNTQVLEIRHALKQIGKRNLNNDQ